MAVLNITELQATIQESSAMIELSTVGHNYTQNSMFLNDICPSYLFVLLERSPPCIVVYMSRAVNPQWPLKRLITYSQTTIKEFDRLMAAGRL